MTTVTTKEWNHQVKNQFPFLKSTAFGNPLLSERIEICRLDKDFLDIVPSEETGTDASGWSTSDIIEMWSKEGKHLGKVKASDYDMNNGLSSRGETVGDAISRIIRSGNDAPYYITRYQYESSSNVNNQPEHGQL